jgi:hypothetical protein
MISLKAIGVIGALAVGVLVVSKVVTGASGEQTPVGGGAPFGRSFGVGSAVGGAKAGDTIYNFPAPVFPEMPVYEMPEALLNGVADETTMPTQPTETKKSSKAVSGDTFVWGGEIIKGQEVVSSPSVSEYYPSKKEVMVKHPSYKYPYTGGFFGGV